MASQRALSVIERRKGAELLLPAQLGRERNRAKASYSRRRLKAAVP